MTLNEVVIILIISASLEHSTPHSIQVHNYMRLFPIPRVSTLISNQKVKQAMRAFSKHYCMLNVKYVVPFSGSRSIWAQTVYPKTFYLIKYSTFFILLN